MLQVAEKNFQVELKSVYGLSQLRDYAVTSGAASLSHTGDEFKLSTSGASGDRASLTSLQRGTTVAGATIEAGIAVRFPSIPTGSQIARWGYFDGVNGAYFGMDAGGIFIAVFRNGIEVTKVYQSLWNLDPLNGNGVSRITLSLAKGNVFQVVFITEGYGIIEFRIILTDISNTQIPITVHRYNPSGITNFIDPNQPIRAEIDNGNTGPFTPQDLFVANRYIALFSRFKNGIRTTTERHLSLNIGNTFKPVISFRKKKEFPTGRLNSVRVSAFEFEVIAGEAGEDLIWELYLGGNISPNVFSTPTNTLSSETALESNITATTISGGILLDTGLISGNGDVQTIRLQSFALPTAPTILSAAEAITLIMRTINQVSTTVHVIMRMREEW